jgi:hypothetical protein
MFKVVTNKSCSSEKCYIIEYIISYVLGLEYQLEFEEGSSITSISHNGRVLEINDVFLDSDMDADSWLSPNSLPLPPLEILDSDRFPFGITLSESTIPIIYGSKDLLFNEDRVRIGLDIFGSAFFMLSRYEEVVKPDRDLHNRFPAIASLAYQEGFLMRPIVNEYIEILWSCMKYLWPAIRRKKMQPRTYITCDVDHIRQPAANDWLPYYRRLLGDLIKRRSIKAARRSTKNFYDVSIRGKIEFDPYKSFGWMMDVAEKHNRQISFFFLADHSNKKLDGDYSIDDPDSLDILRRVSSRGHEVGIHFSYETYKHLDQSAKEFNRLKYILNKESISSEITGGRQHFLRWSALQTPENLDQIGLEYDCTLGYADYPGFRCGICYDFPLYNLAD